MWFCLLALALLLLPAPALAGVREEVWPVPGSEDTELGVFIGPEVGHGETKVYAGVQA
jgi:hypothetical protein